MKLLTYAYQGKEEVGVLAPNGEICPIREADMNYASMNELIEKATTEEYFFLRQIAAEGGRPTIPFSEVEKRAPIPEPKQDMICLGINYLAHAEESARFKQEAFGGERPFAVYFSKRINRAVADGEAIQGHFDLVEDLDYEAELAVVIRKETKKVSKEEAYDAILGYTIINDVSARTLQTRHKQWYFGKSLDGFTPMGPWIVTADEFQTPPVVKITSKVNGELRQNSSTGLLIFDIAHIISELSQGMTLKPGTIIATGTPAGAGMGFVPPRFLKEGDIVECAIEGIGHIVNPVK